MKILKSRKALSPVVASIILIAVTVAVSIAVAAWMGALTFSFMGSSSMTVTSASFNGNGNETTNTIVLYVKNTGTKQVTVGQIKVNNVVYTLSGPVYSFAGNSPFTNCSWSAGQTGSLTVNGVTWQNGNPYAINLYDTNGNGVGSTQQTAPGA